MTLIIYDQCDGDLQFFMVPAEIADHYSKFNGEYLEEDDKDPDELYEFDALVSSGDMEQYRILYPLENPITIEDIIVFGWLRSEITKRR